MEMDSNLGRRVNISINADKSGVGSMLALSAVIDPDKGPRQTEMSTALLLILMTCDEFNKEM